MCGLAGAHGTQARARVEVMLSRIAHRGPDGRGVREDGPTTHGHVRLALVDLTSASAQPFVLGSSVLSFNGEVWNHRELRVELEARGRRFRTTGDTEVLATAIDEWGLERALERTSGMFALAWTGNGRHVLARDRYGKIPLYVLRLSSGAWEWASERKAWETPAAGAAQPLPPGTVLDLDSGRVTRWYLLPDRVPVHANAADVAAMIDVAVGTRLEADAPVCVLVSGGLDSSLILAAARRRRRDVVAFTAYFDRMSADLVSARRLCAELEVPLREVEITTPTVTAVREALRTIEIASKAQVEIALMCLPLARRIAAEGFKACLTGEGADELFGGYGSMKLHAWNRGDATWRAVRVAQLEKMSRGNFVRCNKVFMAAGVEARLPFLDRPLVEAVLALGQAECPPNKALLKQAAANVVPSWVVRRQKDTFQGGSGIADACARAVASPARFYNAEARSMFGATVTA